MANDVFKILRDLELKTVGLDPATNKMQEGYFVSFRTVGLPIHGGDFDNPWSPQGGNLDKDIALAPPADPKTAPTTASGAMTENAVAAAQVGHAQQSYLNTFLLLDDKLRMNNQYAVMPGAGKVSDAWWAIITGANGIPTDSVLNPAMKHAYEAANAKLMNPDGSTSVHYQMYMQYQDAWLDKRKQWFRAYSNAISDPLKLQTWPNDGLDYQDATDTAWDRWNALGFKQEIEAAIATLAAQGTDPAIALIARAKTRFEDSLNTFMNIGKLPYTKLLPVTWYDKDNDDGWYNYGSTDFHTETHYQASATSYGGGGGFGGGWWTANAGFNHEDQQSSLNIATDNLDISFQYCAVDVKRPWLEADLLNVHNWFLMGDYKRHCISDGTMGQEVPAAGVPQTFLPSVVTTLILIKDLRLKWTNGRDSWDQHSEQTSGGASVGFGPFAVNGSYSHHSEARNFEATWVGEWLTVPGIQLIGYVSMINPPSPGVNSADYLKAAAKKASAPAPVEPG